MTYLINSISIILIQVIFIPVKTSINQVDFYAFIALALNLTYMAIAFNSLYFNKEYVILSQINKV